MQENFPSVLSLCNHDLTQDPPLHKPTPQEWSTRLVIRARIATAPPKENSTYDGAGDDHSGGVFGGEDYEVPAEDDEQREIWERDVRRIDFEFGGGFQDAFVMAEEDRRAIIGVNEGPVGAPKIGATPAELVAVGESRLPPLLH